VSFVDAVLLMAASPRPIYFVMDHRIFRVPVLGWLFRLAKAIPIAPYKEDPQTYEAAFERATQVLREGDLLAIFPEGGITKDGQLQEFKGGIMKIIERARAEGIEAPVIPMALTNLWGSYFSRIEQGGAMVRPFRRGFYSRVGLNVGEAVAPAAVQPALWLSACSRAPRNRSYLWQRQHSRFWRTGRPCRFAGSSSCGGDSYVQRLPYPRDSSCRHRKALSNTSLALVTRRRCPMSTAYSRWILVERAPSSCLWTGASVCRCLPYRRPASGRTHRSRVRTDSSRTRHLCGWTPTCVSTVSTLVASGASPSQCRAPSTSPAGTPARMS